MRPSKRSAGPRAVSCGRPGSIAGSLPQACARFLPRLGPGRACRHRLRLRRAERRRGRALVTDEDARGVAPRSADTSTAAPRGRASRASSCPRDEPQQPRQRHGGGQDHGEAEERAQPAKGHGIGRRLAQSRTSPARSPSFLAQVRPTRFVEAIRRARGDARLVALQARPHLRHRAPHWPRARLRREPKLFTVHETGATPRADFGQTL